MIITTVLRSGGIYGLDWAWAVKRNANEHMRVMEYVNPLGLEVGPGQWTYVCLTDMSGLGMVGELLDYAERWPGWWAKLSVFNPDRFPEGALILYMDLDTSIVGDLRPFADYPGELALLSDFYQPSKAQTGVMLFRAGSEPVRSLWDAWTAKPTDWMRAYAGDGQWVHAHAPPHDRLQDVFPGLLASFKVHARSGPPDGAVLVCAHGKPKQDDPKTWMHKRWKT